MEKAIVQAMASRKNLLREFSGNQAAQAWDNVRLKYGPTFMRVLREHVQYLRRRRFKAKQAAIRAQQRHPF